MAIQQINLGTAPNGVGGDTLRSTAAKINENFSNADHAASKLVGSGRGQIPLAENAYQAVNSFIYVGDNFDDANLFEVGTKKYYRNSSALNSMSDILPSQLMITETIAMRSSDNMTKQIAHLNGETSTMVRVRGGNSGTWTAWTALSTNIYTYKTTTAAGANVVVTSTGELQRSTSSERYKDIIADLTLDDITYNNAMSLAPIIYRSTANADNPNYHYYSFSAEALGAFDPAFVFWRETEEVEDEEGNLVEQPLENPIAEGLNINALLSFSHSISVYQDKKIKDLEARLEALETNNTQP